MARPRLIPARSFCAGLLGTVLVVCSAMAGHSQAVRDVSQHERRVDAAPRTLWMGGTVVDASTRVPLRHAMVTGRNTAGEQWNARADLRGVFRLGPLSAGDYTVSASASTYFDLAAAPHVQGRGRVIEVRPGPAAVAVEIALHRGAVVTGLVTDPADRPRPGATVTLWQWSYVYGTGQPRLMPQHGGTTDDRGRYRLFGIAPGEYYLSASDQHVVSSFPPGTISPQIRHADVQLVRNGGTPPDDVLARFGGGRIAAMPPVVLVPTFHPGIDRPTEAGVLRLAAGDERTVDLVLQQEPVATVSGEVVLPARHFENGVNVNLLRLGSPPRDVWPSRRGSGSGTGPGAFTFTGVVPGEYVLIAQVFVDESTGTAEGSPTTVATWSDSVRLTVAGVDIDGLRLSPKPGVRVSGRVRWDGSLASGKKPAIRLRLSPAVAPGEFHAGPSDAAIAADGTFSWLGVPPGQYTVAIAGAEPNARRSLWVASAVVGGHDAGDLPVQIGESDVQDVAVVLTDRKSTLSGKLTMASGDPASGWIVAFSTDPAHWVPRSRRVAAVQAFNGAYGFAFLPPGEFFLSVVLDVEEGRWFDPSFLSALRDASPVRVTVRDGATVQDLRRGGS
jgi:hypothetical protein